MRKTVLTPLIAILILSVILPVNASTSATKVAVDDSLFVRYDFENLNSTLYDQIKAEAIFNITTIPRTIKENLERTGLKLVNWGLGPQTNIFEDANQSIHVSFLLGGSDIVSVKVNGTTMKRVYQLNTEWRKFKVNFTSNFTLDFAQSLSSPLADWQRINATSFYYENKQTGTLDVTFSLVLPTSASDIRVQGDTIFFDMPPRFEDQLLNSPFLILGAIAVTLVIALIYRKVR